MNNKRNVAIKLKRVAVMLSLTAASFIAKSQQASFVLTVKPVKPMPGYKSFLFYKKGPGNVVIDSVGFADGKFSLTGNTPYPQRAILYVEKENSNFSHGRNNKPGISFYLEKGEISVTLTDGAKTVISGTPLNNDYQAYLDVLAPFKVKEAALSARYVVANKNADAAEKGEVELAFAALKKERQKVEEQYLLGHTASLVSLEWLKTAGFEQQEKSRAIRLFGQLSEDLRNSPMGRAYAGLIKEAVSVEIGSLAPDFTAKDLEGKLVALSSFRGKYVLLDFWASWCVPCRKENPNVLKAFNNYKDKNFSILAFSLDEAQAAWSKAVKQDGLPWTQVSDLAGWGSQVARMYGISAIPANVLIDPQGKIIARDLRGESLQKTLAKVL